MKKIQVNGIVISICMFLLGVFLLLWADKVTNMVSLILGAILIAYGVLNGINYINNKEKDTINILSAVVLFVIGIILISRPSIISEVISFVVGLYIILSSISNLKIALNNKSHQNYHLGLVIAIGGILIGVLCVLGKLLIPDLILRFIGLMLIIFSIIDIIDSRLLPLKKIKE